MIQRNILVPQAFAVWVGVLGPFRASLGEMWRLIALPLGWASSLLVLTWLFQSKGAEGVSVAYLLAYVVHLGTMNAFTCWKLKQGQLRPLVSKSYGN